MRRDKKKDLILDFTSLLDVVMLLLFFFIIFSRFDVTRAETEADNAKTEAEAQVAIAESQAQEKIEEAKKSKEQYDILVEENSELQDQLEHEINIVNQVTPDEAKEIITFNRGNNLKLILVEQSDPSIPMMLRAVLKQKVIGECYVTEHYDSEEYQQNNLTGERLVSWMNENGIKKDSVVMCDLVYSSQDIGSGKACDNVVLVLKSLRDMHGFNHFYYSTTNISIGSEGKYGTEEEGDSDK